MPPVSLREHPWQPLAGQAAPRQPLLPAVLLALAVHGAVVVALLSLPASPVTPAVDTVLQASWIAAPTRLAKAVEEKPEPKPQSKPLPRTKTPPPLLTARSEAAAPPTSTTAPAAPISLPPQTPAAEPSAANTQARNALAPAITEPQFNADYLSNPAPDYPHISREMKEQGLVQLRVFVGPDGRPQEAQLHRSSGFDRLDQAALAAVRQWRFVPAKRGSETLAAWVIVPINFSLRKPS
jgi:protein TonB